MLTEYKNYLQNPNIKSCKELVEQIHDYSFPDGWTDELTECFNAYSHVGNHLFLEANNLVSNTIKPYTFGPSIPNKVIEYFLEQVPKSELFKLNTTFFRPVYKNDYIGLAPYAENWDVQLINYFKASRREKIKLYAAPNVYLFLVKSKVFQDFCNDGKVGTVITTGEPAVFDKSLFKKTNVFVNDSMINWKSGLNFYTCCVNKKHLFPLFYWKDNRYYNLLNLWDRRGIIIDDLFQAKKEAVMCECGKRRIDFKFIPHFRNYPRIDCSKLQREIENANEQYFNYQFIETGGKVMCLKSLLSEKKGMFFKVGAKRPAFWKSENLVKKTLNEDDYYHCPNETIFVM